MRMIVMPVLLLALAAPAQAQEQTYPVQGRWGQSASLEKGPIDVLLTDVHLPDMSGPDLATEARRRLPDVRIVYASGSNPPAHAAADFYHLLKPYTQDDLQRALEDRT